jgi:hypothetical protein
MGAAVRFYDRRKDTAEVLPAPSLKKAKQLFDYARSCATADMRIELLVGGQIVQTHWVNFEEKIPSVREMPRYA